MLWRVALWKAWQVMQVEDTCMPLAALAAWHWRQVAILGIRTSVLVLERREAWQLSQLMVAWAPWLNVAAGNQWSCCITGAICQGALPPAGASRT